MDQIDEQDELLLRVYFSFRELGEEDGELLGLGDGGEKVAEDLAGLLLGEGGEVVGEEMGGFEGYFVFELFLRGGGVGVGCLGGEELG